MNLEEATSMLPASIVRHPTCGACLEETDFDGDDFICEACGLNYGDEDDDSPASYLGSEAYPCGEPCPNTWHRSRDLGPYECTPCVLPWGHISDHWTACRPVVRGERS